MYYGKQLRAELGPDVPFTFCVDSLPKARKDRDRRMLTRVQRDNVVRAVAARLPLEVGLTVIHGLKHRWSSGSYTLEALVGGLQVDPLLLPKLAAPFPPELLGFDCEFATPTPAILPNDTPIRCCTKGVCCNVATVCRPAAPIVGFVKISLSFKDATSSRKSTRRTTPLSLGGF